MERFELSVDPMLKVKEEKTDREDRKVVGYGSLMGISANLLGKLTVLDEIFPLFNYQYIMVIVIGILAVLSAAAAAGIRIALPLLLIGMIRNELWFDVPLLSLFHPQVLVAILTSWSLFELFGSKNLSGQRVLQIVQLLFSPLVGALMSLTVAQMIDLPVSPLWLLAVVGGLLAFVIKLVQVGWFFRLRGIPIWVTFVEDLLCVGLVLFALNAPENGGLIALLLLWIVIRSSSEWRRWYLTKQTRPLA